jgi:hypothetical protein
MKRIRHLLLRVVAPVAAIAAIGLLGTPAAHAYGPDHVYQLTFSLNCNDRTSPLCAPDALGLGGVWGWIEPDSDGTADATVTFCGHQQGFNGAFHENLDEVPWSIVTGSQLNGAFPVGTDPTDHYIVFPGTDLAFVAFPVTPNHYSTRFGPGITAQSTVVLMH